LRFLCVTSGRVALNAVYLGNDARVPSFR
jgi:hypothetical protein